MTSLRRFGFCLLFGIGLVAAGPSWADVYYVSTVGKDTDPGTKLRPFRTVQHGVNTAKPGDTVRVEPGVYLEHVDTARAGEENRRITIDGQNGATVSRFYFRHPHITLQNMTVTGNDVKGSRMIYFDRGAHHSIASNNVVDVGGVLDISGLEWRVPSSKPIGTDAASFCLVISNRVTGVLGDTGIGIFGTSNQIVGNIVHDLGQADFVRLFGQGNVLRGNTFSNIFQVPGVGNHIDFIQTFTDGGLGSIGHMIEGNIVSKIQGGQLTQLSNKQIIDECGYWIFRNNLFIDVGLQASISIPGIHFYNNTFIRCNKNGSALSFNARPFEAGVSYAHNGAVINNIFFDCGDGTDNKGWYGFTSGLLTNVVADFNFVADGNFNPKKAGLIAIGADVDGDGVGDWEAFRFFEPNGINGGDPGFLSLRHQDFRLRPDSILRARGLPVAGVTVDILGRQRSNPPSIGAFEFHSAEGLPRSPVGLILLPD